MLVHGRLNFRAMPQRRNTPEPGVVVQSVGVRPAILSGVKTGRLTLLALSLSVGGLTILTGAPAGAVVRHPSIQLTAPVCVSGLDVSVTAAANWRGGPVGTIAVNWGDGSTPSSSSPAWHLYDSSGTFTITLTATSTQGTGTKQVTVAVGATAATCIYSVSPQPIAEPGSLVGGQSVPVTVNVSTAKGKTIRQPEPVWLSFTAASGGGTSTACCAGSATGTPLAPTPVLLSTGTGGEAPGQIVVAYTVPHAPPSTGTDQITASPVAVTGNASVSTTYQYATSPEPLAPPASIAPDCSVDVSKALGQWLRNLPANTTVEPAPGSCYQVDEGLLLTFPSDLTVDGGTYENLSTQPQPSNGHGTQRGNPVFNVLGGSGVTFENLTIEGADPGGYVAKMAFASGIQFQGTHDATVTDVSITNTFGDGITLDPLRNESDHEGSGILSPTDDATISDITIDGAGRMGMAFVSVNGASVSTVSISNVGLDTFDVESDQSNEGTQNLDIDGCTSSTAGPGDFFADAGSGSGPSTGHITVSNCVMEQPQSGTVILIDRPGTGSVPRGPFTFENDTLDCGTNTSTTSTIECVMVWAGTLSVDDSSLTFPPTTPAESVYHAAVGSTIAFDNDTVSGYGSPGSADSTSTVTVVGGTWTPAS
jgi:hypothetical protein